MHLVPAVGAAALLTAFEEACGDDARREEGAPPKHHQHCVCDEAALDLGVASGDYAGRACSREVHGSSTTAYVFVEGGGGVRRAAAGVGSTGVGGVCSTGVVLFWYTVLYLPMIIQSINSTVY
jgi:hypothetical protein